MPSIYLQVWRLPGTLLRSPSGSRKTKLIENLFGGNLLGAAEDINLGHVGEAQFVNLHLSPEGNEAYEGVIG